MIVRLSFDLIVEGTVGIVTRLYDILNRETDGIEIEELEIIYEEEFARCIKHGLRFNNDKEISLAISIEEVLMHIHITDVLSAYLEEELCMCNFNWTGYMDTETREISLNITDDDWGNFYAKEWAGGEYDDMHTLRRHY